MDWKMVRVAAALALAATTASVQARVIDFEGLESTGDPIDAGYAGFDWDNFAAVDPYEDGVDGFQQGLASGNRLATNIAGQTASFGSNALFALDSAYFSAAHADGLSVAVTGYAGNDALFTKSFTLSATDKTLVDFGWWGVDRVRFEASGGTDTFGTLSGTNFTLDDVTVSAVPEPSSWLALTLGVGLVGGLLRRRASARRAA